MARFVAYRCHTPHGDGRLMHVEFRQVDGPYWKPGTIWQVELHAESRTGHPSFHPRFPVALAWVSDDPYGPRPALEFVLVPDHYRRRGLAKRIIAACRERWPDLRL